MKITNTWWYRLTNSDGKIPGLLSNDQFVAGTYKMRFETEEYFNQLNTETFYPYVEVSKDFTTFFCLRLLEMNVQVSKTCITDLVCFADCI